MQEPSYDEEREAVWEAVRCNLLFIIKTLVKKDRSLLSISDSHGRSLLHVAAEAGAIDTFLWLQKQGLDSAVEDYNGVTCLHLAIEQGQVQFIKILLPHLELLINVPDAMGQTPLHYAAELGSLEIFLWLLEHEALLDARDEQGKKVLHYAVENGHFDITDWLLNQGIDINDRDDKGRTALHIAAGSGHLELIKELQHLFQINKKDKEGKTALAYAALENERAVIEWLLDQHASAFTPQDVYKALIAAAQSGGLDSLVCLAAYLSKQDLPVIKLYKQSGSILHIASTEGHVAVVNWILDNYLKQEPTPITQRDADGNTPLHLAAQEGHLELVKSFLIYGTSIDLVNNKGRTMLHLAAYFGHEDVVLILDNYLKQEPTLITKRDADGNTPLHLAAQEGHLELVKSFLIYGTSIDLVNNKGRTMLHLAAYFGHEDVVLYLLKGIRGLNYLTQKDGNGKQALHLAAASGVLPIIKMLLEAGLSVTEKDDKGKTILHIAIYQNRFQLVEWLIGKKFEKLEGLAPTSEFQCFEGFENLQHLKNYVICPDQYNLTALDYAVHVGNFRMVNALLQLDCFLLTSDQILDYSLYVARNGFLIVLQALLIHLECQQILFKKDSKGKTIFHHAVEANQFQIIEFLLHYLSTKRDTSTEKIIKSIIRIQDNQGKTPLFYAIQKSPKIALFFFTRYSDSVSMKDSEGNLPLHHAVQSGHEAVVTHLAYHYPLSIKNKNNAGRTALHDAVIVNKENMVAILVHYNNSCLNQKSDAGFTALQYAILNNYIGLTRHLLELKADIRIRTYNKKSVLNLVYGAGKPNNNLLQMLFYEHWRAHLTFCIPKALKNQFKTEQKKARTSHLTFFNLMLQLSFLEKIAVLIDQYRVDSTLIFFDTQDLKALCAEAKRGIALAEKKTNALNSPPRRASFHQGKSSLSASIALTVFSPRKSTNSAETPPFHSKYSIGSSTP